MEQVQTQNVTHVRSGIGNVDLLPVKFKAVNLANGDCREVVAAVAGKKIRVLGMHLIASAGDGSVTFNDGEDGTALSGVFATNIDAIQPLMNLESEWGLLETTAGTGLWVTLVTNDLDGVISYVEV